MQTDLTKTRGMEGENTGQKSLYSRQEYYEFHISS